MLRHNLKLAWRQLVKYHLQSAVSIVSLAVGFACFALAAMWIKYETTYDAFHKDAESLYAIMEEGRPTMSSHISVRTLREVPQLEDLSHLLHTRWDSINGRKHTAFEWVMNDTNFVNLFGLKIQEGRSTFVHNPHEVAISDRLARKLWGDESPIGKELTTVWHQNHYKHGERTDRRTRRVVAVFHYWGDHSNYMRVDILGQRFEDRPDYTYFNSTVFARIRPHVDMDALNAHLDTMPIFQNDMTMFSKWDEATLTSFFSHNKLKAVPITQVRHQSVYYERYARTKVNHIYMFAIAGGLLIGCGLLNYLTMFINRLFIRKREIALRTVLGASGGRLMVQFLTEYGLLLVIAMLLGWCTIELSLEEFYKMAELPRDTDYIHRETFIYSIGIFLVSLLLSVPFIWYFRRQSLQSSITGVGGLARYNLFRRFSTGLQIGISIFCIFCTVVLLKQLDTLRHGDIGFLRENRMAYKCNNETKGMEEEIAAFLRQCPEVDTLLICQQPIYPAHSRFSQTTIDSERNEHIKVYTQKITNDMVRFYGLTLLEGRWLYEGETESVVANETFVRRMGWKQPLEQEFHYQKIVGVVKDFQNESPTMKAENYLLKYEQPPPPQQEPPLRSILLRYHPGKRQALMEKIEAFFKEKDLPYDRHHWEDLTEVYSRMLTSEDNLQKLLTITTGVCILIALFGVWSMIMLTCEQRRKEIAIRKVFGATVKDILAIFFREYMTLQLVAALVAFPVGYACMKPWLENYVVQTEISWWIYAGIFLIVALLVALCIGWRVWKTANARPADEICKG